MSNHDFITCYFCCDYQSPLMLSKLYKNEMRDIAQRAKSGKLNTAFCEAPCLAEYFRVNLILWRWWDPLDMNHCAPMDEYHHYVPILLEMRRAGAGCEALAEKLLQLQTHSMGAPGSIEDCLEIAEMILEEE